MKTFLPAIVLSVCLGVGCATQKQETAYQPVPGPSNVDPALGNLATVTGVKVYEQKDAGKPTAKAKEKPAKAAKPAKQSTPTKEKPIVTPESGLMGKVVTYNSDGRFVVLDFPMGKTPVSEVRLFVYRNGLKVGEVKVTNWRRSVYVVADLTAGEAQPGDEVRDK